MDVLIGALKVVTDESWVLLVAKRDVSDDVPYFGLRYFSAAAVEELSLMLGLRKADL